MITIQTNATADTRTCDFTQVTKDELYRASAQHISDVRYALEFFAEVLDRARSMHDADKLKDIDSFHADFVTGFAHTAWWDQHRRLNRHHLTAPDGIPADVNLIDVLDHIADCVMAGLARKGVVTPLALPPDLLERAFQNTVELLKANVTLVGA